jgi:hypothetical protein
MDAMSKQVEDSESKSLKMMISEALKGLPSIEERLKKLRRLDEEK